MNLVRRLFPFRTCTIDIRDGERALPGPASCTTSSAARARASRPSRRPPTGATSPRSSCSSRATRTPCSRPCATRCTSASERQQYEKAARRPGQDPVDRADDGEPEDGRLRAHGARPRRRWPARTTRRPCSCSSSATARCSAATCSSSTRPRDVPDDEVLAQLPRSSTTPGRPASRARSWSRASVTDTADLEAFLAARRGSGVHLRTPAARREARADGPRHPQRAGVARARGCPLAGRRGPDARRARGARRRAGPARPADADRVLRHQQLPGRAVGRAAWSCSRRAGRGRASTAGSRSGPSRAPTTSRATRRCSAAGSAAPRPGEEGIEEERRWAMPDLVIIDGGRGPGQRRQGGARRAGPPRPADRGAGQGARGAVPARTRRARRPAGDVAGAVPRPAAARRGAPVRDHLPPQPAQQADACESAFDDLPGRGPQAQARAAQGVRVRQARPRGPVEQIAAVPGIGRSLAERIKAHLEA